MRSRARLFKPTTLMRAIERLGFVQADPIRAPARAQDLTLRHRVRGYRAGDLERRYPRLALEEDALVNYGFVPRAALALLHPRTVRHPWDAATRARAGEVLEFVRAQGRVLPRDVQEAFDHGRSTSAWGASLNAGTHLLDGMHYRGMLRVARRESGTRVYEVVEHPPAEDSDSARRDRARRLLLLMFEKYAPMPSASLGTLAHMLKIYGAPQIAGETRELLLDLRRDLPQAVVDGVTWLWPEAEDPRSRRWRPDAARARLLAPFDPVVWDRRRFELLWGWAYRFEAYVPAHKRVLGHYAMPLLWGDRVVGWGTAAPPRDGRLRVDIGYVDATLARDSALSGALDQEVAELAAFLGLEPDAASWRRARRR